MTKQNLVIFGNICTQKYYHDAIRIITEKVNDAVFYVFSDDISWVQTHLDIPNAVYVNWNTGESSIYDMYLMSSCKYNIIANSTFSYWAARLNKKLIWWFIPQSGIIHLLLIFFLNHGVESKKWIDDNYSAYFSALYYFFIRYKKKAVLYIIPLSLFFTMLPVVRIGGTYIGLCDAINFVIYGYILGRKDARKAIFCNPLFLPLFGNFILLLLIALYGTERTSLYVLWKTISNEILLPLAFIYFCEQRTILN